MSGGFELTESQASSTRSFAVPGVVMIGSDAVNVDARRGRRIERSPSPTGRC